MNKQQFIDEKLAEGFIVNTYSHTTVIFLIKGMSAYSLEDDGKVCYSDPSGGATYASIEDYAAGKKNNSYKNGNLD